MTTPVRDSPLALTVLALLHQQPLHPYGIQRLLKQWGKDKVVNVSQRASLYRTIERLCQAGLITVQETGRDQAYPERTVYALSDEGRRVAREWLDEMLAVPRQEFPRFPAALSNLMMAAPDEAAAALRRRADTLTRTLKELDAELADQTDAFPRVTALETEYLRAVTEAEERWIRSILNDLRTGHLTWTPAADPPDPGPSDA
ncbi:MULTISPECIES: PadR family transcriptional regulator [Streptomyces]|uniref:PadR family transcriptional regulator n=1 Tax=Streptomyces TaxID=1883 RepID=UPI00163C0477|nr:MULTISPECIES: PadR family transcriptional regulator [Streptomyces]MBC2877767.1 PadR family transcriptional regulator [Streptomyces sp. TYQ1024]UBI38669.1 PadR family transcriptional regulator [Streptomyces mobaraensis]UKW31251.1 PadR family transcriptional regulator [Streptomyces sp. TYQ1024]